MGKRMKMLAVVGCLAMVTAACGQGGQQQQQGGSGTGEPQRGGTLLAGLESDVSQAFNPQGEYYSVTWGFYHCCLARTLLSPEGVPSADGGNELQPDLATDMPEVSEDGLTYTFTLKDGIMFGPPLSREIVAQDFVTAMERTATPEINAEGYPFYYSIIEGFDAFQEGEADEISGVQAVDDKTLEITLTDPAGDFPFRMAMPTTAPVPAEAADAVAEEYGRYLVSSGPYMFEGSEELDFENPEPVAGYVPGRSIVLVRNPDWNPDTDPLRPAYLDRIEVEIGLTGVDMYNKIERGELHLALDVTVPPTQFLQQYTTNPDLEDQIHTNAGDGINYIGLNLAMPPFDDIHVRKAANLVADKAGMIQVSGGELGWGEPATHVMYDGILDDRLADYDPYPTENFAGDVEAAKEEMRQSRYDSDGDGVCDDPVCENVPMSVDEGDPYPDQAAILAENLQEIGITADVQTFERSTMYDQCEDPGQGFPICASSGWYKDYADPSTFGQPLFGSDAAFPSCCNYGLVGVDQDYLDEYGLEPAEPPPNVDDQIAECDLLPLGDERLDCFAELNQTIMEDVVPWIPLSEAVETFIVPPSVTHYSYDQFSSGPALDRLAISQES